MFDGFKKGSGGRYIWDGLKREFVKVSEQVVTPDAGFNGPVWFPKGGHKYFDIALQKEFCSKAEKKQYMKEHGLMMDGSDDKCDRNVPEAGIGKRYYSIPGVKTKSRYYKYR